MKNVKKRILSIVLCLTFLAVTVFIPFPFGIKANAETTGFSGVLGSEWSVGWNSSETPADEFVKISSDYKKVGVYSLRIGHPLEKTQLTLKLQIPVGTVEAYQYALYTMASGDIESLDLYVRDGAEGKGEGNILGYSLTDKVSTSWLQIKNSDNATDDDTDGSATEITVDSGVFCLDIGVTCPAGSYVYFDNIDVFATSAKAVQLNRDSSFERWYGDCNVNNYNIEEFVTNSGDNASLGDNSMRIGHSTLDTDIVLKRYIPTIIGRTLNYNYFNFDYYIQLPETADAETAVITDYVTTATVTMKGYSPSTSTANKAVSNLTTGTAGTWVADNGKTNVAWCGGDAKTYLYVEMVIKMTAGTFIYLDNVTAGNCGYQGKTPTADMMFDGSFEEGISLRNNTDIVVDEGMPHGWYLSWSADNTLKHQYLTKNAYEGERALYISARDNATQGHTIAQNVSELTAGETYVFEAYVRKYGDFTSARMFRNDHNSDVEGGASNISIVSNFPDSTYSSWTKLSGTFAPTDSDTTISIYMVSNLGGWIAVDNVVLYKQSDESKTNLIINGGFEPYTPPPEPDYFEGTLEKEWSCLENGSDIDYTKFVDVTRNQAYNGNYAMKIGYAYANTDITLRYKKAVENGEYTYSAYLKATDTPLSDSAITLKDGEDGTAVSNSFADLTDAWTNYTGTVTVTNGELIIDIKAVLKAGKYVYIDYMNIFTTDAPANQINTDASFERFIVRTNNADGDYADSDFLNIVDDKASDGSRSMRIGNADVATDIVVEYIVPIIDDKTGRDATFRFAGDMYFDGDTTDSASYIRYGVLNGANWRQINLSSLTGKEWVSVNNSNQTGTDTVTLTSGGPYLYKGTNYYTVRFVVKCDAGEYLYIDNLNVYNKNYISNNLLADASFENYDLKTTVFTTDTSLTSALVKPSNWSVSWNSNLSYRYHYRSNEAHSGDFALALTAKEKGMGHTFKQSISSKIEVGATYTVEGYFKKVGTFSAVSLMETASGVSNNTFKQLKDVSMNDYTFVSATFTARAGSAFNIYTVSTIDSLLLVDDLKIYKSDDETKTNLLVNGGFENWKASNQEQYRVKKSFKEAPKTFEATVKLPADFSADENAGVIVGNYNGKDESFNLEVTTNGNPRVYIRDAEGKSYDLIFDTVDLRTGEWTHIAVVKNTATIDLYVDGVLSGSKDFNASLNTAANPYAISGDNITVEKRYAFTYETSEETNPNYFKGEIKNVAFYDDIRTAEEIANDVTAYGTEGLIATYNMWNTFDPEVIADDAGNGYYALRYGNFIKELQAEDDDATAWPYSFVAVGDTQYVCERDKKKGTNDMTYIYDWIVNNREEKNIKFVMGLGDITDENTVEEYAVAAKHLQKLNDAGIPQSIIRGNHDGPNDKIMDLYDECLKDVIEATPYDGIMTAPVFDENGDLVSGTYDNMYYTVEVGEQKWLIFALGYQPTSDILAWAGEIIEQHSDYNVILTTHGYINGKLEIPNTARQRLWDELGCKYENIKLILCGDCTAIDIATQKRVGINGNVVTEVLIDRQTIDQAIAYGHVTLLRFSADGAKVKFEDFASVKEKYFRPSNQFIIDISSDATANDAALFNFDDYLNRNKLYGNKDAEIQNLVSELKTNIATAEGNEAVTAAYNTARAAVIAPEAPTVALEGTTATITATDGYEYSTDGINWQSSPTFTDLPIDTAVTFYQRKSAETTGGYASLSSTATECMIVSAPRVLVGETSIWVKPTEGYEYSIGNDVWQESNVFNDGVINGETYTVYQRPIGSDGMTLLTNGTTITVDGTEPIDNPTITELARMRNQLLENGHSHDISMDYNDDYIIDARDIVKLKKFLAYLDVA